MLAVRFCRILRKTARWLFEPSGKSGRKRPGEGLGTARARLENVTIFPIRHASFYRIEAIVYFTKLA